MPEIHLFGSESGQNQGGGKGFGGGRVQRVRSGSEGSVAPPESLERIYIYICMYETLFVTLLNEIFRATFSQFLLKFPPLFGRLAGFHS